MKLSNLSKFFGAGMLAASLAVVPFTLPAQAQVEPDYEVEVAEEENDFDWGWLGLIGLFGLAGLAGRKRREPVHTQPLSNDPNVTSRPGSDYR